jgi:hypothetical protein
VAQAARNAIRQTAGSMQIGNERLLYFFCFIVDSSSFITYQLFDLRS